MYEKNTQFYEYASMFVSQPPTQAAATPTAHATQTNRLIIIAMI